MNTPKHSPGPWEAHGCTVYQADDWKDGVNQAGQRICSTYDGSPESSRDEMPTEQQAANARLIAAAPELLQACKSALDAISEEKRLQASRGESVHYLIGTAEGFLRTAIAKATGGEK